MQGKLCSTENLVIGIWQQLEGYLPEAVQLHCIKLYETPRIYVDILEMRKNESCSSYRFPAIFPDFFFDFSVMHVKYE